MLLAACKSTTIPRYVLLLATNWSMKHVIIAARPSSRPYLKDISCPDSTSPANDTPVCLRWADGEVDRLLASVSCDASELCCADAASQAPTALRDVADSVRMKDSLLLGVRVEACEAAETTAFEYLRHANS